MKKVQDFFDGPGSRLRMYETNTEVIDLFEYLSRPETIMEMINYSKVGRPALEAVVATVENVYLKTMFQHDANNYSLKQATGKMIRFILEDFGWVKKGSLKLVGSNYFVSASTYRYEESVAIRRLVLRVEIEDIL